MPQTGKRPTAEKATAPSEEIPNRYSIRESGSERILTCIEAPNLLVQVKNGLSVSAAAMAKSPPGTIYLDGVAQNGPLLDHARQVYNFDHHEGCIRTFTLSTCEQVLLMIKKGLDLRSREWKIFANDPDLDTVLAVWLLLNHIRINEQESIREHILLPLVRLQGSIDSLGLELKHLTGLPPAVLNQSQRIIDHLRRKEIQIKKEGRWEETDFLEYTVGVLHDIDQIVYESKKFGKLLGIEELARVNLPDNRVAVVLQSDMGIYEIEPQLKKIYGGNIGLAILRRSPSAYTLRQVDPFLRGNLEDVYDKLNFMDPAVKYRNVTNKWGGASDIGGSPRESGTMLTPEEIAKGCRDTFQKYSFLQKLLDISLMAGYSLAALFLAELLAAYWRPLDWFDAPLVNAVTADPYFGFSSGLFLLATIILVAVSGRRPWQFGIIRPLGKKWWLLLPLTVLAAFAGGAWAPMAKLHPQPPDGLLLLITCILLTFSAEYLFRSVLHGVLAQRSRIQNYESRYFISWPNLGTACLYSIFLTFLPFFPDESFHPLSLNLRPGSLYIAAFLFSMTLGFVRERSHSFFTAFLFHLISVLSVVFLPDTLMSLVPLASFLWSKLPL
ncbi:MAG: type II CAAX prenyl endopeptidase Rce1 family protein [Thermodesulfobacteriota bacterium]